MGDPAAQLLKTGAMERELAGVSAKVFAGQRLNREDGLKLLASTDLLTIGILADHVREKKSGNRVYFINNTHINHTNVCRNLCRFCAFGRKKEVPAAYTMTLEEIAVKTRQAKAEGVSEIHIVGGLNPDLPFSYYEDMLHLIKDIYPEVHIQAFDGVEIDFISEISGYSLQEVLERLGQAGLGSLPGGGAEIFDPEVRQSICPTKISGQRWLEVHRTAHGLGFRSNATMLYGHIERPEHAIDHLIGLRELQDDTGGFMSFIPLAFHPQNTEFAHLPSTSGYRDLKTLAVSRLMLDNFPHIKAFWIMLTLPVAQVSLSFGVDDLDGTVREEKIVHDAGARTPQYQPPSSFLTLIREAGRVPVERDTLYNIVREEF
ncbi:MAG: aminofutalosine synthase MqnE [Bacillota bacterium]